MKRGALGLLSMLIAASAFAAPADCPDAGDVAQAQLLGEWQAEVEGEGRLVLTLARHPEFAETVRGFLLRAGRRVELAGDVDDGQLTLEESDNGRTISAAWLGDVVEGSCGREIRGEWKADGAASGHAFVLRKQR